MARHERPEPIERAALPARRTVEPPPEPEPSSEAPVDPAPAEDPIELEKRKEPDDLSQRFQEIEAALKNLRGRRAPENASSARTDIVAVGGQPNRFFTLELAGNLGGAKLDPKDQQTWARLAYFLSEEAKARHFLVYPDGTLPVVRKQGETKNKTKVAASEPREMPTGDRSSPTFKMVLEAKASSEGKITFYGTTLANKYACTIQCRLFQWDGKEYRRLADVKVEEKTSPSADNQGKTSADMVRLTYDLALERLARKLAALPFFNPKPQPTKATRG